MSDEKEHLTLRISGEEAGNAEVIGQSLSALDALFKEVARSQGIDPDAITLQVGQMGWVCDGCERPRPEDHADWIKRDGLDFCPDCQPSGEDE